MGGQEGPLGASTKKRSGSEKRQRTKIKLVRLTDTEASIIEEAAQRAGLTVASYCRMQMLGRSVPRSVRRPVVEKELLARALGQLGKAGSNLNQIAHAANLGDEAGAELGNVLTEVRRAAAAILSSLGRPD